MAAAGCFLCLELTWFAQHLHASVVLVAQCNCACTRHPLCHECRCPREATRAVDASARLHGAAARRRNTATCGQVAACASGGAAARRPGSGSFSLSSRASTAASYKRRLRGGNSYQALCCTDSLCAASRHRTHWPAGLSLRPDASSLQPQTQPACLPARPPACLPACPPACLPARLPDAARPPARLPPCLVSGSRAKWLEGYRLMHWNMLSVNLHTWMVGQHRQSTAALTPVASWRQQAAARAAADAAGTALLQRLLFMQYLVVSCSFVARNHFSARPTAHGNCQEPRPNSFMGAAK